MRVPLLLVVLIAACRPAGAGRSAQADVYAVYAAALDAFAPAQEQPVRVAARVWPYALGPAVGDTSALYRALAADSAVGAALLAAYDRANRRAEPLCACFPPGRAVELVASAVRPGVPGPVLLSGVGFDARRTRALVTVGQVCGLLCGTTSMFVLERRANRWTIAKRALVGAS